MLELRGAMTKFRTMLFPLVYRGASTFTSLLMYKRGYSYVSRHLAYFIHCHSIAQGAFILHSYEAVDLRSPLL
jgi:hypothetical protein